MNYRYTGPVSGLHLPGQGEVVLVNGQDYTLPVDNDDVRRLERLRHLTALDTPNKPVRKEARDAG